MHQNVLLKSHSSFDSAILPKTIIDWHLLILEYYLIWMRKDELNVKYHHP